MTNRDEKGRFVKTNRDDELSQEGVENLLLGMVSTPKTSTPSIEEIRVEAYKRGYSDGFQYGQNVTICGRKNSVVWSRVKSSLTVTLKYWQTILIVVLIGWMAFGHFTQGTVGPPTPVPSPTPIIVQPEIGRIVSQSPSDPTQRKAIAAAYRNTADLIQDYEILTMGRAMSEIRSKTQPVMLEDAWKETGNLLNQFTADCSNVESLADKLYEIADSFEKASQQP